MNLSKFFDEKTMSFDVEAMKERFHEICSKVGVWTKEDKGCDAFGIYLGIGEYCNGERLTITSPKFYLSENGNELNLLQVSPVNDRKTDKVENMFKISDGNEDGSSEGKAFTVACYGYGVLKAYIQVQIKNGRFVDANGKVICDADYGWDSTWEKKVTEYASKNCGNGECKSSYFDFYNIPYIGFYKLSGEDADFDKWVTEYLTKYSGLFDGRKSDSKLFIKNNPEPWNQFTANEGKFRKALSNAFASKSCNYIDMCEQYDRFGQRDFEVESTDEDDTLAIYSEWQDVEGHFFKFLPSLEFTVLDVNSKEIGHGNGYEAAAEWYTLNVANPLAKEHKEYDKNFFPECYKLWVYFREDFYASNSKKIWKTIEGKLENGSNFSNSDTQDYVDDKAAVWECVYIEDLKVVLDYLTRKHPNQKILIQKDGKDVTSAFWKNKANKTGNEETTPKKDLADAGLLKWAKEYKGKVENDLGESLGTFFECIGNKRFGVAGRKLTSYYFFVGEKFYVDDGHGKAWLHKDADVAYALNRIITALLKAK